MRSYEIRLCAQNLDTMRGSIVKTIGGPMWLFKKKENLLLESYIPTQIPKFKQ